jgi:lysozyme
VLQLTDGNVSQGQLDALTSFVFNLGSGKLKASTLLRKHRAGNYTGAAAEFGRWIYGGGKPLPGLIKRRAAEAHMYLSGELP